VSALLAALALAALPEGAVRYRAELAGEPVGVAELRVACRGPACEVAYETRLRLPAESGGGIARAWVEVEVDRAGRYRGGRLRAGRGEAALDREGVPGAVPAAILELVLAAEAGPGAGPRCIPFFEEEADAQQTGCGRWDGGRVVADVAGVGAAIVPGPDGFPDEVRVEGRFRFVRDPSAAVPRRAPRLAGTRVAAPEDPASARRFCGIGADAEPATPASALPAPRAPGASCREKTAAYLAAARARGLDGRTAVGVAWDGSAFVWHAWAEVLAGGAWVPVDPSFGQLPARGPRFTLGRWGPGERRAQSEAGAKILACWGSARVQAE
jgi:hypothetical protein